MIKVHSPLVSVDWLYQNLDVENLLIFDATIPKVTSNGNLKTKEFQIKGAHFFDIKNVFSDVEALYPNTILSAEEFETKVQSLGVNKDSCIVVYDDLGIYSSPRVWWMFTVFGFKNIAVLDGGFPAWKGKKYPTGRIKQQQQQSKGNFKANFKSERLKSTTEVLSAIKNENKHVLDARSKGRFNATEPEPRKEVRGGRIPNSKNLPYGELFSEGKMKSKEELKDIFDNINPNKKELIFSCGSGITACILALGAEIANHNKFAVYDGSWTEWGSRLELPIEK